MVQIQYLIFSIIGYILGSILFSFYIPKILCNVDIIKCSEDGNPGTANAVKLCGFPVGMLCLSLDLLKGILPVALSIFMGAEIESPFFTMILISPVIGHMFPIFNKGYGGKSIAVTFGVLIGIIPSSYVVVSLIIIYILFSTIFVISPHSLRSICTFTLFSFSSLFIAHNISIIIGCFLISALVIYKHLTSKDIGSKDILLFGKYNIFTNK